MAEFEALGAGEFVIAADLRSPFVMPAGLSFRIVPQAGGLRFLSAKQPRELLVDFIDQFLRHAGEAVRVMVLPNGPALQQDHR